MTEKENSNELLSGILIGVGASLLAESIGSILPTDNRLDYYVFISLTALYLLCLGISARTALSRRLRYIVPTIIYLVALILGATYYYLIR